MLLLSASTSSANGTPQTLHTKDRNKSSKITVFAWGTFAGSDSIKLQASYDGTTFIDVPNCSFTAAGLLTVDLRAKEIRAVSAIAAASSLNMAVM